MADEPTKPQFSAVGFAIGLPLGLPIAMALDDLALFPAFGIPFGLIFAYALTPEKPK
ncbi:hypothetical protein [uncultured Algimonas sp.]|uniref:hypothetical protein n=1 Tax=uncultured Algimonas sp. TaxID=1547920 RepID=UPI00260EF2FE|nr:hypothetical protein [uncultured Algimonas sp.]